MAKLKPGDRIDCRVKQGKIVGPYRDCDEIKTFEVVATDEYGYYLFVPEYYRLRNTEVADMHQCRLLGIDKKFLDENITYIQENLVYRVVSILDGEICLRCREFYPMAEPNQPDDGFICYSCRFNPYR